MNPRPLGISPEAMVRALRLAHRSLSADEFCALLAAPESPEEIAERQEQIRWFQRYYPTPALRLAKARKSFLQWSRSIPDEVKAEERRLRDEAAARPVSSPFREDPG
jgi:hypothetical protein